MRPAELVPCLVALRSEFDAVAPDRDRASDGAAGDRAHEARVSDHNDDERGRVPVRDADNEPEIHALDVDVDLRNGAGMEQYVRHILARCRSGAEQRLRYIIYNRRIWAASNGWRKRAYTGDNPHTGHAHFSASYDTAREADTGPWRLEEVVVMLSEADKQWITEAIERRVGDAVPRWDTDGGRVPDSDPNPRMTVLSALFYIGSALARIERAVKAQTAKQPAAAPAAKSTRSTTAKS